jgi:hypothetical protein
MSSTQKRAANQLQNAHQPIFIKTRNGRLIQQASIVFGLSATL